MKKAVFLIWAMILIMVSNAFSQNMAGIGVSLNFANISHSSVSNSGFDVTDSYTFGGAGLVYERILDKNWSLVSGITYMRRGTQSKLSQDVNLFGYNFDIGAKLVHRMDYIEVPVLAKYSFKTGKISPYFVAGPVVSYESGYNIALKAHMLVDFNLYDYDVNLSRNMFNRYDLSAKAGAGLSIPVKKGYVNLEADYIYGISDILNNPVVDFNLKHRNVRLGISYMYKL